ncbi:hypothetical protein CRI94_16320 [Longibacter salinarum]|uniref:Type I-E CRISPR-associated protein Cse2/CasB n=1 Tax=Longibacter salinarum TaxID=1850348 RepID=A0A2A8CU02_9BACT|nr:type I-E CRISPR-associated protein Cse2/CasB [Longibacter salinarum]PEN11348.1 hypothetical protein CRI94_16320 [Longibacter salinarum]
MYRFQQTKYARADAATGETPAADASTTTSEDEISRRLNSAIGKIARRMGPDGEMSNGNIAELRRISSENPFTPALWKVLFDYDLENARLGLDQDTYERRMATLLMGMAHCAGLHDYGTSLGQALAEAGWSELRFVRLMEARGETLESLIRRLAQYLASKGQPANWVDVARLLLQQEGDKAETTRLNISRSYYGTLYSKENTE